jgi:hypothetical protein
MGTLIAAGTPWQSTFSLILLKDWRIKVLRQLLKFAAPLGLPRAGSLAVDILRTASRCYAKIYELKVDCQAASFFWQSWQSPDGFPRLRDE